MNRPYAICRQPELGSLNMSASPGRIELMNVTPDVERCCMSSMINSNTRLRRSEAIEHTGSVRVAAVPGEYSWQRTPQRSRERESLDDHRTFR
jgi:hypothetical protein